jgi:hypothetical protein
MSSNSTSSNYIIILCLFALLGYTCVISCITYLMVIINTPKCQEEINKNNDIEENNEKHNEISTISFIRVFQIVILFVLCSLLWITRLNLPNNQETPIIHKTKIITELIRIEKKIAFYDIRQHHINVDFKSDMVDYNNPSGKNLNFVEVLKGKNGNSKKLVLEHWIRINNIKPSIFDKKSDDLLIYTKDIYNYNGPYDRSENVGYTIDNKFIDELLLDTSEKWGYVSLLRNAYYLHNKFYEKIKKEYKKIEDKYNSIPLDFDFDKLMNEVQINENEMDVLEVFDSKRRKLEIREMTLLLEWL